MAASTEKSSAVVSTSEREIVVTRVFDAPRELVWEAFTDPAQVVLWWGPKGFSTTIHEMDLRPGGVWRHTMHGPDGTDYPNKSVFIEVVKPERIVYSHGGGKAGGPGVSFEATWTFEAQGDKTALTLRQVFPSAEVRERIVKEFGAVEGAKQTMGRLAEHLEQNEFVISRTFDAPRDLVWKAFTDPECMKQWWGPKGAKVIASKMDLRPGGIYHYGMQTPDGHEMWGKFVYREIVPPERLVLVSSFSDKEGKLTRHPMSPTWPLEMFSVFTFTEHQGKTTVTIRWSPLNASEQERKTFAEGHASMQQGWSGTFEQLAAYLATA
ncbi:MAG TPA: SRPBCC family protein [Candidatus Angelobacter sp.]|nr:SRPBCC family protein [Candidatus Angelobacter sp.]